MTDRGTIIVCAGGTGGHLFPAQACADELSKRGYNVHLATDQRAKRFAKGFANGHVHVIPSATITGKNPFSLAKTLWQLLSGVRKSRALYRQLKPKLVIGFGGYPTLPPLYAASSAGIKTLIHEQNGVMGRANKALAARVDAIAGGFLSPEGAYADKIIVTGNPVRESVVDAAKKDYRPAEDEGRFNLLVFGGSQGASFFDEIMPQALKHLDHKSLKRLDLVQQSRHDEAALNEMYQQLEIHVEIAPFFDNMAERIAKAHFIIARSGASTVSEIAAIGRPALLVPYPYALDHDQAANAAALAQCGGVKVVEQAELTPQRMCDVIKAAMRMPDFLMTQAEAAKKVGRLDAAVLLADLAEGLIADKPLAEIKDQLT